MWRVTERLVIDVDKRDYTFEFAGHREAYLFARGFACTQGAVYVNVYAPDGSLAHEWHRRDNIWRAHAGYPVQ